MRRPALAASARNCRRSSRSDASIISNRLFSGRPASTHLIRTRWNGPISPGRCGSARRSARQWRAEGSMARYEFKLPDIGEGIAEAEIVAWHVKVGDAVGEDQQLADMMTDKATVEMESPVAGKVLEVAGEVGDMIPIGSVLVVIETEGESEAAAPTPAPAAAEEPIADGMAEIPEPLQEVVPTTDVEPDERRTTGERRVEDKGNEPERREGEWRARAEPAKKEAAKALASPAVRQRARDLGIDLSQVRYGGDRIRHHDLDAHLLYSGAAAARGPAP